MIVGKTVWRDVAGINVMWAGQFELMLAGSLT